MSVELLLGLIALFGMAAIGTPVAFSILVGVIVYLGVASGPCHRRADNGAAPV